MRKQKYSAHLLSHKSEIQFLETSRGNVLKEGVCITLLNGSRQQTARFFDEMIDYVKFAEICAYKKIDTHLIKISDDYAEFMKLWDLYHVETRCEIKKGEFETCKKVLGEYFW